MELVIPEDTQVHILIGKAPLLALPEPTIPDVPPAGRGRKLLRGTLALVLLAGAFVAGRHYPGQAAVAARPAVAMSAPPPPTGQFAFPDRPLPQPSTATPAPHEELGQVPASFAEQLRQAPDVMPPPGQTPGAAPGKNPFGLEN